MMSNELKRTPLFDEHKRLGGKLVPFAGYEMPVQYGTGIVAEHLAVREHAGLFDVSHMGEIEIRGDEALALVQLVTTNDASKLGLGQAQYAVICQEDGCAIDDCLVYRFDDHYLLVVNAANLERDLEWIRTYAPRFDAEVIDRSAEGAILAIQGPKASRILQRLTETDLDTIGYYHAVTGEVDGQAALISRTGYTGEDGFELYIPNAAAVPLWNRLLEAGKEDGLIPCGLGSRDSLRLEMGYILYGNDLDLNHTPLEAGLGWVVKFDKGEFLGRAALERQKAEGLRQRLAGFKLRDRAFPRHGYEVRYQGESAGEVTSGILSPSTDQGIGLAFIALEATKPGTEIEVVIRNRPAPAEVVRPPFYQAGSLRR
jgi:aminomethyltransferase